MPLAIDQTIQGYLAVVACFILFGTNTTPLKFKSVKEANINPIIFQLYASTAIAVSSCFILFADVQFIWWGVAGAALFTPSAVISYVAIERIGIAMAQSIWCGTVSNNSLKN